jgi:hypothetical protein
MSIISKRLEPSGTAGARNRARQRAVKQTTWTPLILYVVLIILIGSGYVMYERAKEGEARVRSRSTENQQSETIRKFADKYGAIAHWRKSLAGRTQSDTIYSAELSQVLIRDDHRPILFIVKLKDVEASAGKFIAVFEGQVNIHTHLRLILEATSEQASALMAQPGRERGGFALVASVSRISSSKEITPGPEAQLDERPVLIIEGQCVDTLFVENYVYDRIEVLETFPLSKSTN